jgi:hypothetical protein
VASRLPRGFVDEGRAPLPYGELPPSGLRNQNYLAARARLQDLFVRACGFRERQFAPDDGAQRPRF